MTKYIYAAVPRITHTTSECLGRSAVARLDVDGRFISWRIAEDGRPAASTDSKISGTFQLVNAGTHCNAG